MERMQNRWRRVQREGKIPREDSGKEETKGDLKSMHNRIRKLRNVFY